MIALPYHNPHFNRAVTLRKIGEHLSGSQIILLSPEGSIFFLMDEDTIELALFPLENLDEKHDERTFLGIHNGKGIWSLPWEEEEVALLSNPLRKGRFLDLRAIFPEIDAQVGALLAYALGMHKWHAYSRYCGRCGSKTRMEEQGHSRKCLNAACSIMLYPRIAPAVIVLIEYLSEDGTAYCLLNKKKNSAGYMVSTFAGFVEVGETLEEAVRREMKEEVAVDVTNIRYVGSQPWVFSSSLMAGFYAETKHMDFQVDGDEVTEAGWFTAGQIQDLVASDQLVLSKQDSIARFLIEQWVNIHAL